MRSERSTVRTCALRASEAAAAACSCAAWASLARSIRIARSLFCSCERSFWQDTTIPVGRWVIRTAESVVFTLCPPGPLDRNTSTRRSPGSIVTSVSSASGVTSTPAAEVWMRPWDSVAGTRWTRCTPPSHFSRAQTPSARDLMATATSLYPPRPDSCASGSSAAARWIGVSSAKRRPARRAADWSAWIAGSASRASSSAYSSSSAVRRSSVMTSSMKMRNGARPPAVSRGQAPDAQLLGLLRLYLGVLLLELGDPAGGVEHALLPGVERVARAARLDVDHAVLRRAAGLEGVAAGTRDRGRHVLRVDVRLHVRLPLFVVAGSPCWREPEPGLHLVCHAGR